jgi:hypothetical protein
MPHVVDLLDQFRENLLPLNLFRTILAFFLFFAGFWILIIYGYSKAPDFIKTVAWGIPIYLIAYFVFMLWYETRILMSLYPALVPLGLSAVFPLKNEK